MQEVLWIYGYDGCKVSLSQMMVLIVLALIQMLNASIYFVLGYKLMPLSKWVQSDIIGIFITDICLLSLAAIAIGYLLSKLSNRFFAYAVMVVFLFLLMPNITDVLLDWQIEFHVPIFTIRDLIYLLPYDLDAVPDYLYGKPVEMYHFFGMIFWITLAAMVLGYDIWKKKKKIWMEMIRNLSLSRKGMLFL